MEKKNNTLLISIVVILIIALIGFNFESITGQEIADTKTTITVSPNYPIQAGERITITINPGPEGVYRRLNLEYSRGGGPRVQLNPPESKYGSYRILKKPFEITYITPAYWNNNPGVYYIYAFDYQTKDWVKSKDSYIIIEE